MKNNSFLIENFEEILIQKSFEDLNDAEKEQLKIEKISKQEYDSMREMFLQMQEIEKSEEIPDHSIKDRLMAEFATPQKVITKNKIISINRWFYLGIAASLTLAFVLFYKLSDNVNRIDEKQVVQSIENENLTNNKTQPELKNINDVFEVYTEVKADTLITRTKLSEIEQSSLEKEQLDVPSPISKETESAGKAEDNSPQISKAAAVPQNKDMNFEEGYRTVESTSVGKMKQVTGISLAEISHIQDFTVEIY